MDVRKAIKTRRAFQKLEAIKINESILKKLAEAAQIAPSCFNNQPWRYYFITESNILKDFFQVYSKGNEWAENASLVIVVYTEKEMDCIIRDREYYLYDTGIASGFIMLQATELGLVAHPIAGYSPRKVRKILNIPDKMQVINLIIVGKHPDNAVEQDRPPRINLSEMVKIIK